MNERNVPTPFELKNWRWKDERREARRSIRPLRWQPAMVSRIVRDGEFYATGCYVVTRAGKDYGFPVEPLIAPELFDRADRRRRSRRRPGRPAEGNEGLRVNGNGVGRTGRRGLL